MPDYAFRAIGRDGVEVRGEEPAASLDELTLNLKRRQLTLLRAAPRKARAVPMTTMLPLLTELSSLANSGVPLDRALGFIEEDSGEPAVAALAGRLRGIIKRGEAFSRALEQVGRFDGLLVALVRVGEVSGELARVLAILEEYYQDARKIQRDLLASLTYPAILLVVSVLSVVGLSWYVIPTFKDLFAEDAGRDLPLGTRIVFAFSDFVVAYGWMAALALLAFGAAAVLLVRGNERVNRAWSRARLGLPLLGELAAKFAAFKLAKALSIMLAGGLPLARAMEIAQPLLTNRAQREGMEDCLGGLRKGEPVPRAMARIPALPVQFHRYVKLGNETGDLGGSLGRVADILREDFRNRLRAFVALLDPLIIIGMGGVVGFMVISILLAVFNLSDVH